MEPKKVKMCFTQVRTRGLSKARTENEKSMDKENIMDSPIKKIVLDLGKKEITLTCKQAKQLKEALDELFGKEIVREVHHDRYPWHWYYHNPWPDRVYCDGTTITCSTGATMTNSGTLKITA